MPKRKKVDVVIRLKDRWDTAVVKVVDSDKPEVISRRVNEACSAKELRRFKNNHEIVRKLER